jgi:hypothetical protein
MTNLPNRPYLAPRLYIHNPIIPALFITHYSIIGYIFWGPLSKCHSGQIYFYRLN